MIHLRTLHVGPDSLLVAAKVAVRRGELAETITATIDDAERRIRAAAPIAGLIYLEPDLYEATRQDTSDPAVSAVRAARGGTVQAGQAGQAGRASGGEAGQDGPDAAPILATGPLAAKPGPEPLAARRPAPGTKARTMPQPNSASSPAAPANR